MLLQGAVIEYEDFQVAVLTNRFERKKQKMAVSAVIRHLVCNF